MESIFEFYSYAPPYSETFSVILRVSRIPSESDTAIERPAHDLCGRGVGVVLLNMPVSDYYIALHPNGMRDYTRYLGELTDLPRAETSGSSTSDVRCHPLSRTVTRRTSTGAEPLESVG